MVKQYIGNLKDPEAIVKLTSAFHKNRQRLDKKDIYQWDADSLKQTIDSLGLTNKQQADLAREDAIVLYEDEHWMILLPKSADASCKYGSGTKWCISGNSAKRYLISYSSERGQAIAFILNKQKDQSDELYKIAVLQETTGSRKYVEIRDAEDEEIIDTEDGYKMEGAHEKIVDFLKGYLGSKLFSVLDTGMKKHGDSQIRAIEATNISQMKISKSAWNKIFALVQKMNSEVKEVRLKSLMFSKNETEIKSFEHLEKELTENWSDYVLPGHNDIEVSFRISPVRFIMMPPSVYAGRIILDAINSDNSLNLFEAGGRPSWETLVKTITIKDIVGSRLIVPDYQRVLKDEYPSNWTLERVHMGDPYMAVDMLRRVGKGMIAAHNSNSIELKVKDKLEEPEEFRHALSGRPTDINPSEGYVVLKIYEEGLSAGSLEDIAVAITESYNLLKARLQDDSLGRHFIDYL